MSNDLESYESRAFAEEQSKLDNVIQYITQRRRELAAGMPATAAHQETADLVQKTLEENDDSLASALEQPYFGRIDYIHKDEAEAEVDEDGAPTMPKRTAYIGKESISQKYVFSWTAPIGRLWYAQDYEDAIRAPKRHIPTRVDLKRYLRIRTERIAELRDMFRRQLPSPLAARHDMLTEALSGTGSEDGHLQEIVETIEPEQYRNIANVSDTVLIVQGAAGSGKSEIGLHRIAFLLSPHNEIAERERPTPSTTLFVGPSQEFLEYADALLPALGVRERVQQVRFSDWLMSRFSERPRVQSSIWNSLLAQGDMRKFDEQAETFKSSLLMADVMNRHVTELMREIRRKCLDLLPPKNSDVGGITITKAQVRSIISDVLPGSGHLNLQRNSFATRMDRLNPSTSVPQRHMGDYPLQSAPDQIQDPVPWWNSAWKHIDFRAEYVSLLSDPERMIRLTNGTLTLQTAIGLAESVREARHKGFDDSDVGALAYLDNLLNGTVQPRYRHIVVDEAQDISPIEFKLLAASSINNWFTVLGDIVQRLTPYRGIRVWRDIERVFGRSEIAIQPARRSYRSNKHITLFNNRILKTFNKSIPSPLPFERDGHRVEYNRHKTLNDMYEAVIDDIVRIRSMERLENAVIAILARDTANLNRFQSFCDAKGMLGIIRAGHHGESRTVLARIPETKGLEYDAVIVIGVNRSFTDTFFNKKLLYLATTRAKHYLSIHWSGTASPILRSISYRGVNWHRQ